MQVEDCWGRTAHKFEHMHLLNKLKKHTANSPFLCCRAFPFPKATDQRDPAWTVAVRLSSSNLVRSDKRNAGGQNGIVFLPMLKASSMRLTSIHLFCLCLKQLPCHCLVFNSSLYLLVTCIHILLLELC